MDPIQSILWIFALLWLALKGTYWFIRFGVRVSGALLNALWFCGAWLVGSVGVYMYRMLAPGMSNLCGRVNTHIDSVLALSINDAHFMQPQQAQGIQVQAPPGDPTQIHQGAQAQVPLASQVPFSAQVQTHPGAFAQTQLHPGTPVQTQLHPGTPVQTQLHPWTQVPQGPQAQMYSFRGAQNPLRFPTPASFPQVPQTPIQSQVPRRVHFSSVSDSSPNLIIPETPQPSRQGPLMTSTPLPQAPVGPAAQIVPLASPETREGWSGPQIPLAQGLLTPDSPQTPVTQDLQSPRPSQGLFSSDLSSASRRRKEKKPETYSGKDDLEDYLTHFERVTAYNEWDDDEAGAQLAMALTGAARQVWVDSGIRDSVSYKTLSTVLRDRFQPKGQEDYYQSCFHSRRREKGESLIDFACVLKRLARRGYPMVEEKAREIIIMKQFSTDLDGEIKRLLRIRAPKTVEDMARFSMEFELDKPSKVVSAKTMNSGVCQVEVSKVNVTNPSTEKTDDKSSQMVEKVGEAAGKMSDLMEKMEEQLTKMRQEKICNECKNNMSQHRGWCSQHWARKEGGVSTDVVKQRFLNRLCFKCGSPDHRANACSV